MKTYHKGMRSKHKLRKSLVEFMMRLNLWEDSMEAEIPTKFENYNGLILVNHPSFSHQNWYLAGEELWILICSILNGDRLAVKKRISDDNFRTPQVKLLRGNSSIATFTDNRIKYQWDVTKTMFSRGNVTERHRIAELDCSNDVVVDLFAGIGYFTLPYLVKAKAKHVHACEWNPDALESLRHNLSLNEVSGRCTIYEGDNRLVCPRNVANRVNLGLIPSSEPFWEVACQALVNSGGILFVHQNVESDILSTGLKLALCDDCAKLRIEPPSKAPFTIPAKVVSRTDNDIVSVDSEVFRVIWKKSEWFAFSLHLSHEVLKYLESFHGGQWTTCVREVFKVKSYAPHIDHLVFTVLCSPS